MAEHANSTPAPTSRRSDLAAVIFGMEECVRDVPAWSEVLLTIGASTGPINPEAIFVVGRALQDVGAALNEQYNRAFALSRPQAEPAGGAPCS